METKEWRHVDKSKYERRGPWDREPDKIQWQDESTGLPCLIVRGPSGALCGYVGVAEGHKYYGKEYENCPVDVHGGLTFSDFCQEDKEHGICHIPGPGQPDKVWWFGFDCAHSGDVTPAFRQLFPLWDRGDTYKDIDYVRAEVSKLAAQLAVL